MSRNIDIASYENMCASCKLVTLDRDENIVCYATYKELYRGKKCDCNAYECSGEIHKMLLDRKK